MKEDLIDNASKIALQVPTTIKTIGILSIIGSSLWIFMLIISIFYMVDELSGSPYYKADGLLNIMYLIFAFLIVLNVLGIIGAAKIRSGNKGAFILYVIVTGIWALIMLFITYALERDGISDAFQSMLFLSSGLTSICFTILFGLQMKNMPIK